MKQSLHARRMERRHKRSKKAGKLSLVSLMDIFTILVFFLLVNSSDVEVLQTHESVDLPESVADQQPKETLVVMVNRDHILLNGRRVAGTQEALASGSGVIEPLQQELEYRASRRPYANDQAAEQGRDITIMGDKSIPYTLLKRIMTTCAETEYRNISLAVSRVAGEAADPTDDVELESVPAVEG